MALTDDGPPTKRIRADSDAPTATRSSPRDDPLPLGVLVVLIENSWLGAKEIGCIETLSKGCRRKCSDEAIWTALCQVASSYTAQLSSVIAAAGGHRPWYRYKVEASTHKPSLPRRLTRPPGIARSELKFLVDINVGDVPARSVVLDGDSPDVREFWDTGAGSFDLPSPFYLGTWTGETQDWTGLPVSASVGKSMEIQVQLLRPSGLCCLHSFRDKSYSVTERTMTNSIKKKSDHIHLACLAPIREYDGAWPYFDDCGLPFRTTPQAADVKRHLGNRPMRVHCSPIVTKDENSGELYVSSFSMEVQFASLVELTIRRVSEEVGDDRREKIEWNAWEEWDLPRSLDVSLLHVFEQIEGTRMPRWQY